MKTIKVYLIALIFTLALVPWAQAQDEGGQGQIQGQGQTQGQGQSQGQNQGPRHGQTQGNMNSINNAGPITITKTTEIARSNAIPYQLYPPNLAPDFGNGNTYGNFVKVPAAFSLKHRFTRCELETMLPHSRTVWRQFRNFREIQELGWSEGECEESQRLCGLRMGIATQTSGWRRWKTQVRREGAARDGRLCARHMV